jgi:hypothetical protein
MNYSQVIISPQSITENIDCIADLAAGAKQTFSDIDVVLEHRDIRNYGTCEPDQYLLDGSMTDIPNVSEGDIGFCGAEMSGADGSLITPIQIGFHLKDSEYLYYDPEFDADGGYAADGLTLVFKEGEYCPSVNIKWYSVWLDGGEDLYTLISSKDFTPDSERYFCENEVEHFGYVLITLNSTYPAYRFPKLEAVEIGNSIIFEKDELTANKIYEEVSPLSIEFPGCNGEFTVLTDKKVDLVASDSIITNLEEFTPVDYFYKKDGILKFFGRQFLSEWESNDEKHMTFKSVSQSDIMSNAEFYGEMEPESSGFATYTETLIGDMKYVDDFVFDESIGEEGGEYTERFTGYFPKTTRQESLRAFAFASFRAIDTTRSDKVNLRKQTEGTAVDLPTSRIIIGGITNTEIKNLARATMTLSTFKINSTAEELYSESIGVGLHTIEFSDPVDIDTLTSTGTYALEETHPTYVVADVRSAGTVTVSGKTYKESFRTLEKTATVKGMPYEISAGGIYLKHEPQTLVNNVFDFYSEQYTYEFDMILEKEKCLDWIAVPIRDDYVLKGQINSLEIDFVNGLKTHAKVVGKVVAV